jgi:hypothetical protein
VRALKLSLETRDLVITSGSITTIEGPQKLEQDLRCFMMERLNADPYVEGVGTDLMALVPDMLQYDRNQAEAVIKNEIIDGIRRYSQFQYNNLLAMRRMPWENNADFMVSLNAMGSSLIREVKDIRIEWDAVDPRRCNIMLDLLTEAGTQITVGGTTVTLG